MPSGTWHLLSYITLTLVVIVVVILIVITMTTPCILLLPSSRH